MDDEAFVETTTRSKPPKSIKLVMNENGSIDWDSTSEKNTSAFIEAIKVDPNGILQNIKEEAGSPSTDEEPSGIADATVLTAANALMVVEAIGVSTIGTKFAPVLKNLHPVVAIKACTVSMEEIKPILPAAKRIINRYVPTKYLGAEYQDIAIVGEHLIKLSAQKFKACVDLAMEIERMKHSTAERPNGRANVTIDGQGTLS